MQKKLLTAIITSLLFLQASAQNYFYIYKAGTLPPYEYNESEDSYDIMPIGSPDDQLSAWQSLPFSWDFYGSAVSGYYVSDNGYITFDQGASVSDPNNVTVPNAGGPNMAIYAFWDDLTYGAGGKIRAFDYGVSPNRIHVIQWYGMVRNGSSASVFASLRIHEGGNFDIIYDLSQGGSASATNGTTGVEDAFGTNGKCLQSAPNTQFPDITADNQDDQVYMFQYGAQQQYDLSVLDIALKPALPSGSHPLQGTIKNYGYSSVTSFRLNYQLNNDPVVSQNLNTLQLTANGGEFSFFTTNPLNLPTAGQFYNFKVWCDNLNNNVDQDHANDSLNMQLVTVLGVNAPKKVLVEKFTATWCGACPTGIAYMDTLYNNYPEQVIGVANHASDGFDIANDMFDFYGVSGIPDGMVDRTGANFGSDPLTYPSAWPNRMPARLNNPTPVKVEVYNTLNTVSGEVTGQIVGRFVDYASGDLRFMLFVTEDSLPATQSGLGPVVLDHILRAMPMGEWGTPGTIPSTPGPGQDFVETFQFTLDPSWNTDKLHIVGAVVRYNIDKRKHEILNADYSVLDNGVAATKEITTTRSLGVGPNPVSGLGLLQVEFAKAATASFSMHDAYGRQVEMIKEGRFTTGKHGVWFDASNLPAGMYFLQVKSDQGNFTEKVIVQH